MSNLYTTLSKANSGNRIEKVYSVAGSTNITSGTWQIANVGIYVQAGDLILVLLGVSFQGTVYASMNTTGFTLYDSQIQNSSTQDTSLRVYYKISDGTEAALLANNASGYPITAHVFVFRNVDNTNPFDVPSTVRLTATKLPSYMILPDIYPVSDGAFILKYYGIGSQTSGSSLYFTGSYNVSETAIPLTTRAVNATATHSMYSETAGATTNEDLKSASAYFDQSVFINATYGLLAWACALRPAS